MRTKTEIFGEIVMAHLSKRGEVTFGEARILQNLADAIFENEQLKEHIAIVEKEKKDLYKELEELRKYKIDNESAIKNVWIPYRDAWFAVYAAVPRYMRNPSKSGQDSTVDAIKTMVKKIQEYGKNG